MKVLLINPSVGYYTRAISNPLGLLALASYLKSQGHIVKVIDRCAKKVNLEKEICICKPDVVGISLMSGRGLKDSEKISRIARKYGITIVAGGYFPTMSPDLVLNSSIADIVVLREGEITFQEVLQSIEHNLSLENILGIAYKKDGKVYINPDRPFADLSDFPELDWSLLNPKDYFQTFFNCTKMLYLYSSKGCPGRCTFCSNHFYNRSTFRKRPNDIVIREIKNLVENYGLNGVYFTGELWCAKKDDAYDFCKKIKEENLKFNWGMLSKINQYTREDLAVMYDAGCKFICFGIESGSKEMQKTLRKNINLDKSKETFKNCKELGITSVASFMIGLPNETEEQLKETIAYIKSIEASIIVIYLFSPIENTEIYNCLVNEGKINELDNDTGFNKKYIAMENPGYNFSKIPDIELKVIKAFFDWKSFSGKNTVNGSYRYAFAIQTIVNGFKSISKNGLISFFINGFKALGTFLYVYYYSHMYYNILKKYNLK